MPKNWRKKFRFKPVHLQAILVLIIYNILSKANFAHALIKNPFVYSFLQVYAFGIVASFVFLYLFSHEDFFTFAKDIEKTEKQKEKKYLNKFYHYSKILATVLIGSIGGPIFLALTLRLFFHDQKTRYTLIFLVIFLSTLIGFGLLKSLILL